MKKLAFAIALFIIASCSNDQISIQPDVAEITIWSGDLLTFTKGDGADPTLEANQDRISSAVWITRGNDGGQIYNAVTESEASKTSSPDGTLWAIGTTADIESLEFNTFRATVVNPQGAVGLDMVLLLEDSNIAMDLRITNWSSGRAGGFTYVRSTP